MTPTIEDVLKDLKAEYSGMEELVRLNKESGHEPDFAEGKMKGLEYAIRQLASLNRQGWTRVEDGLPESENDEIVLVIIYDTMYGVVDSVDYYNGRFQKNSGYDSLARMGTYMDFTERTTHWMYKQLLPNKPSNI